MKAHDTDFIHPEDTSNIQYWSKKWGVSIRQLNNAIIHTGSLNAERLKDYLKKDIWYYAPVFSFLKLLKAKMKVIN